MAPADEIIEDYASSLEWLHTNDRYAINNFTVIAKENTEHSEAISGVLMDHITKAHPNHKLPALYVLDSIAKNIGTPYTLFLGNRLYTTFMGAYSLVDNGVRRKLDEMLKTWKHPVPGSLDSRPVFPPDVTRKMENALIQAKTRTLQVEQRQQREQQDLLRRRTPNTMSQTQWRSTPTPPQNGSQFPIPSSQGTIGFQDPSNQIPRPTSSLYTSQLPYTQAAPNVVPSASQLPRYQVPDSSFNDLNGLERDVQDLIAKFEDLVARNWSDAASQTKLKALRDLQTLLKTQDLPADQLRAVRAHVDTLRASQVSVAQQPTFAQAPIPSTAYDSTTASSQTGHQQIYQPSYQTPVPGSEPVRISGTPGPGSQTIPSSDFLAKLLAGRTGTPNNAQSTAAPPPQGEWQAPKIPDIAPPPSAPGENSLIAQLRASGLLGGANTPPPMAAARYEHSSQPQAAAPSFASLTNLSALLRPPLAEKQHNVELSSASLKKPRTHLIDKLYGEQPNQCLSCGKRFVGTDDGKSRKARHMDWHFRTNQRLADTAQRGQSRSWYVGEMEWIKSRDNDDSAGDSTKNGSDQASSPVASSKYDPKSQFIPVPSENDLPCGICQEKFVPSWNEQLQDFVWMDAIRVGDRIYHASCYAEFRKDKGSTPARTASPDSVLGKRKAEGTDDSNSPAKKAVI